MTDRIACLVFIAMSLQCTAAKDTEQSGSRERPNIIFIMSDDHAYQAISCYGSELIETPGIDRLASEGMRFDRAFVTNSICAPSRAVILTGKHSHQNGVIQNGIPFDGSQQTYPKLLQQAGYQTALVGKWHLATDPTGFDYWEIVPDQGNYYHPEFRLPSGDTIIREGYATDVITDLAINWLEEGREEGKPFMLMYQHKAPHREWWPAQRHLHAFKDEPLPEPETLLDDYSGRGTAAREAEMRLLEHMALTSDNKIRPEIVLKHGYHEFMPWNIPVFKRQYNRMTDEEKANWEEVYGPINEEFHANPRHGNELVKWKYQRYMQDYLACVKAIDENMVRFLDYLDESGLAENTIVVYTSDQGFYLGEHGWFDKRFMYEESFRTPLVIRWPGQIEPGSVNSDLVQNLDFAPTFLEASGVKIPDDMQGMSLLPLFDDENNNWRSALYYHYYEYPGIHGVKRHYGIRTDRYKLIHFYYDIDEWELYDLEKDPDELQNLYGKPRYEGIVKVLKSELAVLRDQYGDTD